MKKTSYAVYKTATQSKLVNSIDYLSEQELQNLLLEHPNLIKFDNEVELAVVKKEFYLPNAGRMDYLMVDSQGMPVAVEVKLEKNRDSRREIVAQIIDYVSDLTSLTVDEVNDKVEGELERALKSFSEGSNEIVEEAFNRRWDAFGVNIRAGLSRYILVMDHAPDDLVRMLKFLFKSSSLDIRLIVVTKHVVQPNENLYTADVEIGASAKDSSIKIVQSQSGNDEFSMVLDEYNKNTSILTKAVGKSPSFRQIHIQGWPGSVHYEFVNNSKLGTSIEIHNESPKYVGVKSWMSTSIAALEKHFPNYQVEWLPKWYGGNGRIRISFPMDTLPSIKAQEMTNLITLTEKEIKEVI